VRDLLRRAIWRVQRWRPWRHRPTAADIAADPLLGLVRHAIEKRANESGRPMAEVVTEMVCWGESDDDKERFRAAIEEKLAPPPTEADRGADDP
jgi:hypothetical protein